MRERRGPGFVGIHDFASFCGFDGLLKRDDQERSTERENLLDRSWCATPDNEELVFNHSPGAHSFVIWWRKGWWAHCSTWAAEGNSRLQTSIACTELRDRSKVRGPTVPSSRGPPSYGSKYKHDRGMAGSASLEDFSLLTPGDYFLASPSYCAWSPEMKLKTQGLARASLLECGSPSTIICFTGATMILSQRHLSPDWSSSR